MTRLCAVTMLAAALSAASFAAHAAKLVALTVGVAHYSAPLNSLPSPVKDANAMAQVLQGYGFTVFRLNDPDIATFQRGLVEFVNEAKDADAAVVFYSGHGFQLNGENYFVPADGSFNSAAAFKADFTTVSSVLEKLDQAHAKFKFLILDACRSDPFVARDRMNMQAVLATAGLAEQRKLGQNTLVSFASAPGETSIDAGPAIGYSLYTAALLNVLGKTQKIEVRELTTEARDLVITVAEKSRVEQVPWETSSMRRAFWFARGTGAAGQIADVLPEVPQDAPAAGFIFPDSDKRALTRADVAHLSPGELRIARNEIFARHGRIFVSADLRAYFVKRSWYHPVAPEVKISALEEQNVQFIRAAETVSDHAELTVARPQSDFLIPDSDKRILDRADLARFSKMQLRIARNEIYARRGRFFKSEDLKAYFSKFGWYKPYSWNPGLTSIELANAFLIQSVENGQ
jgi:hypothetical protein